MGEVLIADLSKEEAVASMFFEFSLFGQRQERFRSARGKRSDTLFVTQPLGRLQPDNCGVTVQEVLPDTTPASLVLRFPRTPIRAELDASNILRFP